MSGVFIIEGMGLRVPAGGLVISAGGEARLEVQTRFDVYPALLASALDHVERAEADNARLLEAVGSNDPEAKKTWLIEEMKNVLVAIVTSAFAIEAFQARVSDLVQIPTDLTSAWKKNRTRPASRFIETMKLAFDQPGRRWVLLDKEIGDVFKFRNFAAHPSSTFREPIVHPDLEEAVDQSLVKFRFENGRAAAQIALRTLDQLVKNPRSGEMLEEWASESRKFLVPLVDRWEGRYGCL